MTATDSLFQPFSVGSLTLANRVVMAPMTRAFSPGGVPGAGVADYYARRAAGGVGLIITEGTWIPHDSASNDPNVPNFHGDAALAEWGRVLDAVHAAGGKIAPQLWHTGISEKPDVEHLYGDRNDSGVLLGPSGLLREGQPLGEAMDAATIDAVVQAYVTAATSAYRMGFDGVELHGAHGYLLDQFFWHETNRRTDRYGGDLAARTAFAASVVRGIRAATAPDFPIILRISQWKLVDYGARLFETPAAMEAFLRPLVDAGIDIFHCSQRRFWEAEFDGSDLNLAGWAKKLSGKPTITVGSVSLDQDVSSIGQPDDHANITSIAPLIERLDRGEFDLVAVGRALIADPEWARKVKAGQSGELTPYQAKMLTSLE